MTPDTYGRTSPQPSAFFDLDSRCWKTSPVTSLWALTLSSVTLPRWGMTRHGELYELPTPEPLTGASACSSLLPTPLASDGEKGGPNQRGGSGELRLSSVVQLFPTPTAMDMGRGRTREWDDWRGEMRERHGNGNGHGRSLEIEAQRLLPTPTSRDHKGANQRGDETCLPGALTALQSPAGSESLDGELPGQLGLDAAASD